MSPGSRQYLRRAGPIGMAPRRSADIFASQGTGGSDQEARQYAQRLPLGEAQTHDFMFVSIQVRVAFRSHGNTVAHPGLQCCTWS